MKNFGAKIFKKKVKLDKLFLLAKTEKYSAPQLAKIFDCEKKTIHGVLNKSGFKIKNLGVFRKKNFCDEKFFINLNPSSAYWAGFITADGCLYSKNDKNKNLSIGLSKIDLQHLINFQKAIKIKSKISFIKGNNSARIGIYSELVFDSLVNLGIIPNKSSKMGVVKIPDNLMNHFIRGFFDGDGCLSGKKVTHLQFSLIGHKLLLKQIQKILIEKCQVSKVKLYPASYTNKSKVLRLQYTGSQIFKILEFIYKNSKAETRLRRKYQKYINLKKIFWNNNF